MALVRICLAVRAASGSSGGAVEAGAAEAGAAEAEVEVEVGVGVGVEVLDPQPAARTASNATAIATGLRGVRMGDKLQNEPGPGGPYRDVCHQSSADVAAAQAGQAGRGQRQRDGAQPQQRGSLHRAAR